MVGLQPCFERLSIEEPIGINFGNASKNVNYCELKFENSNLPLAHCSPRERREKFRVKRKSRVRREPNHQKRDQANEVVVVKVIRFVKELDIRKTDKKDGCRPAIEHSKNDPDR